MIFDRVQEEIVYRPRRLSGTLSTAEISARNSASKIDPKLAGRILTTIDVEVTDIYNEVETPVLLEL